MRGRSRNKGPNPLTRAYESNGPDVKIRGTAQHVADKYAQLARDAHASGDPVAAENYFQHAEHYYRLIAAAQEQFRQQFPGSVPRPGFDDDGDEGDDDGVGYGGYGAPGNGFQGGNGYAGDDYPDPAQQPQPYDNRESGHEPRQPQPRYDQPRRDEPRRDDRRERFQNRGDRPQRQDFQRPDYQRQDGPRQDGPRHEGQRQDGGRQEGPRQDGPRQDHQRSEGPRQDYQRSSEGGRDEQPRGEPSRGEPRRERPRDERRDEAPHEGGLPAFLTTPVRAPAERSSDHEDGEGSTAETSGAARETPRPRRRRRARFEGAPEGGEGEFTAPALGGTSGTE